MKHPRISRIASAALLLLGGLSSLGLGGCYSSTHTAPIGDTQVHRAGGDASTEEERLVAPVRPQPPSEWEPGKKWLVTDSRIRLALRGGADSGLSEGDTLTFVWLNGSPAVTGGEVTDILFDTTGGRRVTYRLETSPEATLRHESVTVPFAIELDAVERMRGLLKGRTLYVLPLMWTDSLGGYFKARHYVPVTVTDVLSGNPQTPFRVAISTVETPGATPLSGIIPVGWPGEGASRRGFASLFSLTDPRKRHGDIYPDVWECITRGEVKEGMTRAECRLSLGAPESVDRREYYGLTRERWSYADGSYLSFDDGILHSFRL